MIVVFTTTFIVPFNSYGLTGGPAQPEFNAFTPIGTSDMVDLASGDFSYNIPLMDIGGFPINLAYSSGVTMDQEASWVGLGWDLSVGQINRQMRGIPDDFDGDKMTYIDNMKDNWTVEGTMKLTPAIVGKDIDKLGNETITSSEDGNISAGVTIGYNSYNGFYMKRSIGIGGNSKNELFSVGLQVQSGPDGMCLSPRLSFSGKEAKNKKLIQNLAASVGVSFNSRQGLSNVNMSTSHSRIVAGRSLRSSFGFLPNHFTPTVSNKQVNEGLNLSFALGAEIMGGELNGLVSAFYNRQYVPDIHKVQQVPAAGYENNHKATRNYVRDFNREKDAAISVNSTNLPLTNYTYDIYNISGQGVSGMFRPFRSQVGYVTDRFAESRVNTGSFGVELGVGNLVHNGADVNITEGYSTIGIWNEKFFDFEHQPEIIPNFESEHDNDPGYEEVYYRNVGDMASDGSGWGNFDNKEPIRIKIGGEKYKRQLEGEYIEKNPSYSSSISSPIKRIDRRKRNQNILRVQADEIATDEGQLLGFTRNSEAKDHHTAGFIVTRNDGARYIYGQALYNLQKQEVAFAMGGAGSMNANGLIQYSPGIDDNHEKNKNGDHFFNKVVTPAYAHTFLLTALVSTDYSDLTGDGLTDDDLGSWTKFTYKENENTYQWRVPFQENMARASEGLKTEPDDDRGSYVYGEKEVNYIEKIETKTHVAIFHTSDRNDGYGVDDSTGAVNFTSTGSKMLKLDSIELYSKGEYYDINGNVISNATPIKVAHFEYSYELCKGVPNNKNVNSGGSDSGKLTLKKVYFTYRTSKLGAYSPYEFTYGDIDHNGTVTDQENPLYSLTDYNIWGNYKEPEVNAGLANSENTLVPDFNYVNQLSPNVDKYAAAWSITSIALPSGGKIDIDYEADDYAYVQDKKPMEMFKVVGAGHTASISASNFNNYDRLFKLDNPPTGSTPNEATFFYIKLPNDPDLTTSVASANNLSFFNKYVKELIEKYDSDVQFRFFVNMGLKGGKDSPSISDIDNSSFDYINGYFKLKKDVESTDLDNHYKVFEVNNELYGSIPVELVDIGSTFDGNLQAQVNPVAKAGWQFGRKFLSKYIYDAGGANTTLPNGKQAVKQVMTQVIQVFQNLTEIFTGPNRLLRGKKIARRFIPQRSWIRLMSPSGAKKGGGVRVVEIRMSDEWGEMTASENANNGTHITPLTIEERNQTYGQKYNYTTVSEEGNVISSGVATFEPVGAKDNPHIQPRVVSVDRLLGPDEENFMETPFGESFFPSPKVTYSKVSVKNLERIKDIDGDGNNDVVKSHATGKVVTEFYTSKDFPTICDQTDLYIEEDGGKIGDQLIQNLLKVRTRRHIAVSQGYTVITNDMNGKMKKQLVFAEGKNEPISGALYRYRGQGFTGGDAAVDISTTNNGRLNHRVKTISPDGTLAFDTKLGVEVDIVNDFREMYTFSNTVGWQGNSAGFVAGALPLLIPLVLQAYSQNENRVNIAVTTKVVNTFGILEETIAFDAGASVSTKNLCWDTETGEVLLTQTTNEYNDKYYSFNYPAHWYYKGMGLASFNSGAQFSISKNASDHYYTIDSQGISTSDLIFEGDEVLFVGNGIKTQLWITEVAGDDFTLKDRNGIVWAESQGTIKILRSGKRNLQSTSMASMVSQKNPLDVISAAPLDKIDSDFFNTDETETHDFKIINAGAVEFERDWNGCVQTSSGPTTANSDQVNEYVLNLKGVYRALTSYLYLTDRYSNKNTIGTDDDNSAGSDDEVDVRNGGFYGTFSPFYQNSTGGWIVDKTKWTYTSTVTKYNPYGFELENQDALGRYSSAQYGYNNMFPMAVSANAAYSKIGFDGFEDYTLPNAFNGHFNFINQLTGSVIVVSEKSHTGKHSLKVSSGQSVQKTINIE